MNIFIFIIFLMEHDAVLQSANVRTSTPCHKFRIFDYALNKEFVAAVGRLRKKNATWKLKQFQNQQFIQSVCKIIFSVQKLRS